MNALWNALAQQIASHLVEVEAGVAALIISGVYSIPEQFPVTIQAYWSWFRDTLQGAVPMKFQKTIHVNPTQPAQEPGKEQ